MSILGLRKVPSAPPASSRALRFSGKELALDQVQRSTLKLSDAGELGTTRTLSLLFSKWSPLLPPSGLGC